MFYKVITSSGIRQARLGLNGQYMRFVDSPVHRKSFTSKILTDEIGDKYILDEYKNVLWLRDFVKIPE